MALVQWKGPPVIEGLLAIFCRTDTFFPVFPGYIYYNNRLLSQLIN